MIVEEMIPDCYVLCAKHHLICYFC